MPKKNVFSDSAASLQEEMSPKGEKVMSMGGTPFARETSKIHTLATHARKWCPGFQNRTPCSQNGAQWSQNEPTIVAKVITKSNNGTVAVLGAHATVDIYIFAAPRLAESGV